MKSNSKFYAMALGVLMTGFFGACTNEDAGLVNGETSLQLVKAPKVIAYSGDYILGTATSRGTDMNGNLWYQNWDRPTNVTEEEIAKITELMSTPRVGAKNDIHIDWNNYWVQQVYTGEATYEDGTGTNIGTGSSHMNHLLAYSNKKMVENVITWWDEATGGPIIEYTLQDKESWEEPYEHINNFNSGSNNTTYTDDVTGEQFIGTTLMTDMYAEGIIDQFGYHNSTDSKNHFEYIIVELDGNYYICFDFYATHPEGQDANKNMDVDRDWIFNDWIVKISPAYHVGETPEKPETPGTPGTEPKDKCENCDHPSHGDTCPECGVDEGCNHDDSTEVGGGDETPGTPDITPGYNEVEVNLHGTDKNGEYLESHLSIHVRAATDVEIFIPVPQGKYLDADDMAIVMQHEQNHMLHGDTYEVVYTLKDSDLTVKLTIAYETDGIRITTDGITQEVIDWCYEKCNDGITFEIWNYFDKDVLDLEELKFYLNQATIKFLDKLPDYYINAFTDEGGNKNEDDCTVSIVEDEDHQRDSFDEAVQGEHLNNSPFNDIYKNKSVDDEE